MSTVDVAAEKLARFRGCSAGEVRTLAKLVIEHIESDPTWTVSRVHACFHRKYGCSKGDIRAIVF